MSVARSVLLLQGELRSVRESQAELQNNLEVYRQNIKTAEEKLKNLAANEADLVLGLERLEPSNDD
jgi:hypothetical protein